MKKGITILILLFACSAKAQWELHVQPHPKQPGKQFQIDGANGLKITIPLHKDTVIYIPQQLNAINRMPNALVINGKLLQDKLILKGNNSKGFNIFESSIDRMKIIMPDSSTIAK